MIIPKRFTICGMPITVIISEDILRKVYFGGYKIASKKIILMRKSADYNIAEVFEPAHHSNEEMLSTLYHEIYHAMYLTIDTNSGRERDCNLFAMYCLNEYVNSWENTSYEDIPLYDGLNEEAEKHFLLSLLNGFETFKARYKAAIEDDETPEDDDQGKCDNYMMTCIEFMVSNIEVQEWQDI